MIKNAVKPPSSHTDAAQKEDLAIFCPTIVMKEKCTVYTDMFPDEFEKVLNKKCNVNQ